MRSTWTDDLLDAVVDATRYLLIALAVVVTAVTIGMLTPNKTPSTADDVHRVVDSRFYGPASVDPAP